MESHPSTEVNFFENHKAYTRVEHKNQLLMKDSYTLDPTSTRGTVDHSLVYVMPLQQL
jgi:hypothetical protein